MKHFALFALILLWSVGVFGQKTTKSPKSPAALSKTSTIKVFLVAVGDSGKIGRKIGCDDSLVAVTRTIKATPAPLKAALEELLSIPEEFDSNGQQLGNYWKGTALKLKSVALKNGVATIEITGHIFVAGICDEPRIEEQIKATAKQFPTVKSIKVAINGIPLRKAIS